jgi:hypothetical protein
MRNVFFLVIVVIIFIILGCAANSTTGSIVVVNTSDKDCPNVKIGDVNCGFVGKGQTVTYYYFTEQTNAKISTEGFTAPPGYAGTIDLKFNYILNAVLMKSSYNYNVSATKVGFMTVTDNYYMK